MGLLREITADGYPTDYLAARVRGRLAGLRPALGRVPAAEDEGLSSDAAIWDALLQEFDWLRRQMNPALRLAFAPVFTLFAIKSLVICLRNRAAERSAAAAQLLRHDLFAPDLRDALLRARDVVAAVEALAAALGPVVGDPRGLAQAYAVGGLKEFETQLTRDFLQQLATARLLPAIRRFFEAFIDLRNLMTLYKQVRWGFEDPAALLAGGRLDPARLREAAARRDEAWLEARAQELAADSKPVLASTESALESRLLSHLTRELRQSARTGDATDLLLDYVWSLYVAARNRSLCLHAREVDRDLLEREFVA